MLSPGSQGEDLALNPPRTKEGVARPGASKLPISTADHSIAGSNTLPITAGPGASLSSGGRRLLLGGRLCTLACWHGQRRLSQPVSPALPSPRPHGTDGQSQILALPGPEDSYHRRPAWCYPGQERPEDTHELPGGFWAFRLQPRLPLTAVLWKQRLTPRLAPAAHVPLKPAPSCVRACISPRPTWASSWTPKCGRLDSRSGHLWEATNQCFSQIDVSSSLKSINTIFKKKGKENLHLSEKPHSEVLHPWPQRAGPQPGWLSGVALSAGAPTTYVAPTRPRCGDPRAQPHHHTVCITLDGGATMATRPLRHLS